MFPDETTRSSANEEAEAPRPDVSSRALAASLGEASSHYDQSVAAGVFTVWTSGPPWSTAAGEQEEVLLPLPHPLFWIPDL